MLSTYAPITIFSLGSRSQVFLFQLSRAVSRENVTLAYSDHDRTDMQTLLTYKTKISYNNSEFSAIKASY